MAYLYIIYILIGTLAGFFMGMIGMGAGIITVPLLVYSGMNIHNAVGCSLLMQLLPQSLPGVMLYHYKGHMQYYASFAVIFGSILGILLGSLLVTYDYISEKMLYKLLTYLLILITSLFIYEHLL